jgi:hypothetical protein
MKINFDFKVNVKRKYIVNGREYGSIEEMPPDVQELYRRARRGEAVTTAAPAEEHGEAPDRPRPLEPGSTFPLSPRLCLVIAAAALLLGLVYYLGRTGAVR